MNYLGSVDFQMTRIRGLGLWEYTIQGWFFSEFVGKVSIQENESLSEVCTIVRNLKAEPGIFSMILDPLRDICASFGIQRPDPRFLANLTKSPPCLFAICRNMCI